MSSTSRSVAAIPSRPIAVRLRMLPIHVVVDNPLGRGDALPLDGQQRRHHAVETPLDTLSAQLGFAPSQIIPVRLAIMFCTAQATSR